MTKQAQIVREIEQMIAAGHLRPGQQLPTQKQLMDRFGVAMGTIQNALARLQAQRVVVATRGRGTVVAGSSILRAAGIVRPRVELLEIGTAGHEDPLIEDTVATIQRTLNTNGFELVVRHELPEAASELNAWAEQLRAAVVIGLLPPRVLQALRRADRPVVIIGELHDAPRPLGVSQVTVAIENLLQLSLTYLTGLNHRRIVLVRGEHSQYFTALGAAFRKTAARLEIGPTADEWIVPQSTDGSDVVERYQQQPTDRQPTVLLVDGGPRACRVAFALQREGIQIPGDLSVFALSGQQPHQLALPSLSRVETTSSRIGHRLAEVLMEVLQHRIVVRETVAPELVRGDTCRSIVDQPLFCGTEDLSSPSLS